MIYTCLDLSLYPSFQTVLKFRKERKIGSGSTMKLFRFMNTESYSCTAKENEHSLGTAGEINKCDIMQVTCAMPGSRLFLENYITLFSEMFTFLSPKRF